MDQPIQRALVVEDDPSLRSVLRDALAARFGEVVVAASVAEAKERLGGRTPVLIVLDVALPDGDAFDVLDALPDAASAVLAISGEAQAGQSFDLASRGVRAYLTKPVDLAELDRVLDRILHTAPDLKPQLRASVGHRSVQEVQAEAREVMIDEALGRSRGSRRAAARLLQMSRQLLQYLLGRR